MLGQNRFSWLAHITFSAECFNDLNLFGTYDMDLTYWKVGPSENALLRSLFQMRGKDARKEMEDGGRNGRKMQQEDKMGLFVPPGGSSPVLPITATGCKIPTKNLP